jgi:hypothetical protein
MKKSSESEYMRICSCGDLFINHSCDPNCKIEIINEETPEIALIAKRKIDAN